jgi:hypothetical protein
MSAQTTHDKEIIDELQALKRRIEQLEAELQRRDAPASAPDRKPPDNQVIAGHEVLYSGNSSGRQLYAVFESPAGQYDFGLQRDFRSGEVQVTQFGVGGDFHVKNVRARLMTQLACTRRQRRETMQALPAANGI